MQHVNGVPVYSDDPANYYEGLDEEPTWFSAQGGVYRCRTRSPPYTRVAIKKYLVEESELYPDLFVMPKELVENEIYTMTKCNHPNILKLLGVYLHNEFVYLIMPYCTGGALQQYVFEHHLTIGQLVHIIKSIAAGLAEVHCHGYIHRDIKCDNIFLVEETDEIVIGDFGVVSITPAADSNVEEAGVVLFWSPELVQRKIVNRKIDVWALGIVILEILNGGKAPYEDEKLNEEEIKQRILENGKPVYPNDLPSRLVSLLDQCLNPDPRERASASDVLQHPFLCDYEPEPLFPASRVEREPSPMSEEESFSEQMSVDDENMGDAAMVTALKKLRALETLHDIDIGLSDITNDKLVTEQQPKLSTSSVDTENIHLDERPPSKTPSLSHPDSSGDRPADRPSAAKRQRPVVSDIRRCRLPIRSFTLSQEEAAAASAEEKVLNVLRKRQSITDAHWGQGSRLPMFKAMTLPPPQTTTDKKIRRAKSVRLPKETPQTAEKPVRKPLVRSNTTPSSQSSNLLLHKKPRSTTSEKKPGSQPKKIHTKAKLGSPSTSTGSLAKSPTSPSSSAKKRLSRPKVLLSYGAQKGQDEEEPPKKRMSMFRRKCAPGESRTARLMMGISTTGRRHSSTREPSPPKPQESEDKNERRPARLLRFAYGTQEPNGKKRPVSVGSSKIQSEAKKLQPESTQTVPLPKYDMKSRRQSVPAAFNGRKSQNGDDKQVVSNRSAALKGVKVVRVH